MPENIVSHMEIDAHALAGFQSRLKKKIGASMSAYTIYIHIYIYTEMHSSHLWEAPKIHVK